MAQNEVDQPQGNLSIYSIVAGITSTIPTPMLNEWVGTTINTQSVFSLAATISQSVALCSPKRILTL